MGKSMQFPLIKDGLVVNVIELGNGTMPVDKGKHRQLEFEENADYEARAAEWQAVVAAHRSETVTVEQSLFMARGIAHSIKQDARKTSGSEAVTLDRVLVADAEVEAWEIKLADMQAQPLPPKPKMVRAARWICPDGHFVGPAGGNVGDSWSGKAYQRPKEESAHLVNDAAKEPA